MGTIRIIDEDKWLVQASKQGNEREQDTLHRLLHESSAVLPTVTRQSERPEWAEELKREVVREVKTAIESAMAR